MLLKLDKNGKFLWARTWGNVGSFDTAGSVVIDANDAPIVAGIKDAYGSPVLSVLIYDNDGNLSPPSGLLQGTVQQGAAAAMTLDSGGNALLASTTLNNTGTWAGISADSGSLGRSLISNPYSTGTPNEGMTALTTPTILQATGVQDTGGGNGDSFVTQYPNVSGTPSVTITPSFLVFPSPGSTQTLTVMNSGSADLRISVPLGFTGFDWFDFSAAGSTGGTSCTNGTIVAPGGSCAINVNFAARPWTTSAESATLTLFDNASDSPQMVPLSGAHN